jgi:hypothetical protein
VEDKLRDVQEVEIIHNLPERLAKLHNGHAYKDNLHLVWPETPWSNAPEYCSAR